MSNMPALIAKLFRINSKFLRKLEPIIWDVLDVKTCRQSRLCRSPVLSFSRLPLNAPLKPITSLLCRFYCKLHSRGFIVDDFSHRAHEIGNHDGTSHSTHGADSGAVPGPCRSAGDVGDGLGAFRATLLLLLRLSLQIHVSNDNPEPIWLSESEVTWLTFPQNQHLQCPHGRNNPLHNHHAAPGRYIEEAGAHLRGCEVVLCNRGVALAGARQCFRTSA